MDSSFIQQDRFQAALREIVAETPKPLADVLNTKMFYILRGASRGTPIASRADIEKTFDVIAYKVSKSRKTGNVRRGKSIIGNATVAAIAVNARRGRAGLPGLKGPEMAKAIQKFMGQRFRAIGTEKAGWRKAIGGFGTAIGQPPWKEVSTGIKGVGKYSIAKPSFDSQAMAQYDVNSYKNPGHVQDIDPRTVTALEEAFDAEAASMEQYIQNKLQPIAAAHNGRP